jgi:signal transduction histidine kinase
LPDGTFAGFIGCCHDINDRKAMALANHELAGRLMSAQEAERTRIARELHDGIGQEISLLIMQMQKASESISLDPDRYYPELDKVSSKLAAIGTHVSHLSHQLHSSELEYLGLTAAITKLCREFSEQYPIKITCDCKGIPAELHSDISLSILRIVQESLHNVAKHSGAKTVQVEVNGTKEELTLLVRDDGTGFDIPESNTASGLGLLSMKERIYLVGGEFAIETAPGVGTSIQARVPWTTASLTHTSA